MSDKKEGGSPATLLSKVEQVIQDATGLLADVQGLPTCADELRTLGADDLLRICERLHKASEAVSSVHMRLYTVRGDINRETRRRGQSHFPSARRPYDERRPATLDGK